MIGTQSLRHMFASSRSSGNALKFGRRCLNAYNDIFVPIEPTRLFAILKGQPSNSKAVGLHFSLAYSVIVEKQIAGLKSGEIKAAILTMIGRLDLCQGSPTLV